MDLDSDNSSGATGNDYDADFTEGGSVAIADADVDVTDAEGGPISSVTISLTNDQDGGAEGLSVSAAAQDALGGISGSSTITRQDTISINGASASLAEVETFLQSVFYENTSQDPNTTPRSIDVVINDGTSDSATATTTVTINAVNDAPTLTDGTPSLTAIDEDAGDDDGSGADGDDDATDNTNNPGTDVATLLGTGGGISDPDDSTFGIAVTGVSNTNGTYQFSTDGGTSWTDFTGGEAAGSATLLDNNDLVRFVPDANFNGSATGGITYKAWDLTAGSSGDTGVDTTANAGNGANNEFSSATDTAGITVNAVNDAPVLDDSANPTLTAIDEDDTASAGDSVAAIVADGSITDVDGGAVEAIAVTGLDESNGTWQFDTGGGFSDVGAVSDGNALLLGPTDTLRFVPDADFNGTATFTFRAWDQSSGAAGTKVDASTNGGITAFSSATDTASITVNAVNDAPVLAGLDANPSFTEGGSSVQLDGDVSVSDVELDALNGGDGNYAGAAVTIQRNGGADASDSFSVAGGGSLSVAGGDVSAGGNVIASIDTSTPGQIAITFADNGTAPTTALVNETLQAVRYQNTSDDPPASVQLDWTLDDGNAGAQGSGGALSDSGSVTVSIAGVNDAPTLSVTADDPTFTEGGAVANPFSGAAVDTVESGQTVTGFSFTVANLADGGDEVAVVDGTDIALTDGNTGSTAGNALDYGVSVAGGTATVTLSNGSLGTGAAQTLVNGIGYRHDGDDPSTGSTRDFTLTEIVDSGGTPNGGDDTGTPTGGTSGVTVVAVNDPPAVANVNGETSQVIAGAGAQDVGLLDDAAVSNPDSADYSGGFLTIVQGSGTANGSWGLDGTTATAGGDATIAAGETVAVGGLAVGTVDATNDGQAGNDLRIDLNANATSTRVQSLLQVLTYNAPSGLGDRGFTLTLNDGDGVANGGDEDTTATFTIDATANPPAIANLDGDTPSFTEGDSPVALDVNGDASVSDPDSADFDGGELRVSIGTGGVAAEDVLSIRNDGTGPGQIGFDGTTVTFEGTTIGTATGGSNGNDLVIALNADAEPSTGNDSVSALISALTYDNSAGDDPTAGGRDIDISLRDAAVGPDAATQTVSVALSVEAVNDAPSISAPAPVAATEETQVAIPSVSVSDADAGGGDLTVTLTVSDGVLNLGNTGGLTSVNGVGSASVTATGTIANLNTALGTLTYTGDTNFAGADTLVLSVDDNGNSGTGGAQNSNNAAVINVSNVNDAPSITSGAAVSAAENQTAVTTVTASDPDAGDDVTFSVSGGADQALFSIDPTSGALTFDSAPDFEAPADADADNVYEVEVTATDTGGPASDTQTLSVTVTNVNEAPTITAPASVSANEDVAATVAGLSIADDAGGNDITVTLSTGNGTLAFGSSAGVTLTGAGTGSVTATGTVAALNAALGTLSYTGDADFNGNDTLTVAVDDQGNSGSGGAQSASANIPITVAPVNDAPTVQNPIPGQDATAEQSFSFFVPGNAFADIDSGDTLTLSAALSGGGALPGWLSFNSDTGEFSGTPDEDDTGSVSIAVTATDEANAQATQTFEIDVDEGEEDEGEEDDGEEDDGEEGEEDTTPPPSQNNEGNGEDGNPVQILTEGVVTIQTIQTDQGSVQIATSQVVSGQALSAVTNALTQGNSPLAQSFDAAVAESADNPSAALEQAVGDSATRRALQDLEELGGEALIFQDGQWQEIDLGAVLQQSAAAGGAAEGGDDAASTPAAAALVRAAAGPGANPDQPEADARADEPEAGLAAARAAQRDLWLERAIAALGNDSDEHGSAAPAGPSAAQTFEAQLRGRADAFDREARELAAALAVARA